MTWLRVTVAVLALLLAVIWHSSAWGQDFLLGQRPDLCLILVCLVGVRVRPAAGALYGFMAGALQGAAAGADFTALALSRTVLGFAASWTARSGLQLSVPMVAVLVAVGSLFAQVAFMSMAPPSDIGRFLGATLGTAIYNGVLAGLLDSLLRRTLDPRVD